MRRWLALAGAVLVTLAAGCTPGQSGDSRVHVVFGSGPDRNDFLRHRIAAFEKDHPNIKIDLLEMPAETDQQHNQYATYLIAEDSTIDVYSVDVVWPAEFGSAGWAEPIENRRTQEDWNGYLKGPMQTCIYNGHTWAVPWYCDAGMLYYRKDLLDAAGLPPPQTWDDLIADCQKLQHPPDLYGYAAQWKQYEGLVCNFLEFVWGNGGDLLTPDGRVTADTPSNVEGLTAMHDWMKKYKITSPEINIDTENESLNLFLAGRAIFHRNWPYAWSQCQAAPPNGSSKIVGKVGICPVPHGPHGDAAATLGGWNLMVSHYSKHKDEAWAFVKYMTDAEAEKAVLFDASQLPSRESVYSDPEVIARMPYIKEWYKAFQGGHPRPVTPYYATVSDTLQAPVAKAIDGSMSPEAALKKAQEDISRIPGLTGRNSR